MPVTPYLFLDGRCEEAIEFYKKHLGAEVGMMMRFKEAPAGAQACSPGNENKIMHACVTINGAPVMLSDGCAREQAGVQGLRALARRQGGGRRRADVQGALGGRTGADAADRDLLRQDASAWSPTSSASAG